MNWMARVQNARTQFSSWSKKVMKHVRFSLLLLPVVYLCVLQSQAQDCHTNSDVAVNLIAPSGSGTLATPVRFTATASSSHAITGYVVYTNASGNYVNAYHKGKSTLDAWVILPLSGLSGAKIQNVFVRAWNNQGFCGDSSTLTITASGTQVPSPLAGSAT